MNFSSLMGGKKLKKRIITVVFFNGKSNKYVPFFTECWGSNVFQPSKSKPCHPDNGYKSYQDRHHCMQRTYSKTGKITHRYKILKKELKQIRLRWWNMTFEAFLADIFFFLHKYKSTFKTYFWNVLLCYIQPVCQ